jgi:protein gp37
VSKELHYEYADYAWNFCLGCDNTIPCWKECWAARVVNRLAGSPNEKVAAAHAGLVRIAGPADKPVLAWTGVVRINEAHLNDPLKWRKPGIVASGYHGDWGLLSDADKDRIFAVMARAPQHSFFPLMKHRLPELAAYLWAKRGHFSLEYEPGCSVSKILPLDNVNIGVSVMTQADADAALPHIRAIAAMGWKVHCWHEPAIGPVNWRGWEFLSWLVVGGTSGTLKNPFDLDWARSAVAWGAANSIPVKIKQIGSNPIQDGKPFPAYNRRVDKRGSNWDYWPGDIKIRQMPALYPGR